LIALLATGVILSVTGFTIGWAVCRRIHNYSFLDVIWSLSVGALAALYAVLGSGTLERRAAFGCVGLAWSSRLGIYILIRVMRAHPAEDARYRTLRERWTGPVGFLLFFEIQALIAVVFSLPFLMASVEPALRMGSLEIIGLGIVLFATAGESIADWQAQAFKRREPRKRSPVLDTGLWRYSRHPNYFFESLVWWGFFVAALDFRYGWVTVVCPLLMLYFLLRVTGIPLTEKHSLESHGDAYREYQRATSRFVPWFPKRRG
jgi:steroid 5-alpha reductase family enzyme